MATKNTRNARMLISSTLASPYTIVTKTNGLSMGLPTDFSEDTSHGDSFKSYLPGLQDWKVTVKAWYDTAFSVLEYSSKNKVSYYFLIYPDYADSQNYYRGQTYFGMDEFNLDLGNTAALSFTSVIANGDVQIIRNGTPL
jgi:hypothetical protein